MAIFLDTAILGEIARYTRMGIARGVTTNPSILLRDAAGQDMETVIREIAKIIDPCPVSAQVVGYDPSEIRRQALEFASWASNVVVKIPIHGPDGELDNLELINGLAEGEGLTINVTAIASAQQCVLAATARASYVSLLGCRINDFGGDAKKEISVAREVFDRMKTPAKLIVGSCRETGNVVDWLCAGADVVTVPPAILQRMTIHPATAQIAGEFLRDAIAWRRAGEKP